MLILFYTKIRLVTQVAIYYGPHGVVQIVQKLNYY